MNLRRLAGQIASVGRYRAQCPDGLVVVNNTLCAEALAKCWGMPPAEIMEAVRSSLMHEDGSLRFGVWMENDETFIQVRPRRGPQRGKGNNKGGDKGSMRGGNKGVRKGKGFVKGVDKGLSKGSGAGKGPFDEAVADEAVANGDEDETDDEAVADLQMFKDFLDQANGADADDDADLQTFKDFLVFRADRFAPYWAEF